MCLLAFSYEEHPRYRLALVGNRDEFFARPTQPANFWSDRPEVLAGRDLTGGGTWLGLTLGGRFATVTNYRDLRNLKDDAPSRGDLTLNFLTGEEHPQVYAESSAPNAQAYNGFNLLVADQEAMWYLSNYGEGPKAVQPGLHGLSNALLDTPWPKVEAAKSHLEGLLKADELQPQEMIEGLLDATPAVDERLPNTGVGLEMERRLSPMFITMEKYGTRCSTALLITYDGDAIFYERTYALAPGERTSGGAQDRSYRLKFT